ncbi:hypothetical protein [Streptomyces radiopugnans]|uniref:hypothetical protein n=1 Tax=Streptomyces radiopugnans TaxID=403935 RepID=UPI003F1A4C04
MPASRCGSTPQPPPSPQGKSESEPRYTQRLAVYLLATALAPRLIPTRASVDLPAAWEAAIDRTVHLDAPHAGHTRISIGRLITVKEH